MTPELFFATFTRFFFVYTPFFILAVYLALVSEQSAEQKQRLALSVTIGIVAVSTVMFLCGSAIFRILGITVDAFRIGAGALLFLSAVSLTNGKFTLPAASDSLLDMAVVPLAIPVTIGPGSVGALIVESSAWESISDKGLSLLAIILAGLAVGAFLFFAEQIQKALRPSGIAMLSKVTGLVLAALSCQLIFTGIKGLMLSV